MSRIGRGALTAGLAAALMVLSAPAQGAPGNGGGGGGQGGGGGGQGGGGGGESTTGSVYADLVIALRDVNGAPILKKYVVPADTETSEPTTEYCVQPVSYVPIPGITSTTNPVDGRTVWVVPLQGEWIEHPVDPLPVEEIGACDPQPADAMFVAEVEMERLNLARTDDRVIEQKVADVQTKLRFADSIALESTGRISFDGTPIDASPENAAIYQSLMKTGTIPGLPTDMAGPPAQIGPAPADATSNSRFDAWELAAVAIGAAASKSTPLTIDAVEYYNRIIGFPPAADPTATPPVPPYESPWGVNFVRSEDPDNPGAALADSEQFVDYSGFTYNRSQTFKGSVTWLDVANMKWVVSKITDVVPFTNLSSYDEIGDHTLTGITAFAQLADDVRALCNYIPDNTFIPGFYMDVPGVDTTAAQQKAITDPAVDLGILPADVFQTAPFQLDASVLNPWGGTLIGDARVRVTIAAPTALADGDVVAQASDGQALPLDPDGSGNLVGWWGPETGFAVPPGYHVTTTFDVTVADAAPVGDYTVTLDLVTAADPATVLAQDTGTLAVHENAAMVLWGDPLPKLATQGVATTIPLRVYSPTAGTGRLTLTVTGPGDDPATTDVVEALAAGDVSIYGSNGTDMVALPLSLGSDGTLSGTWDAALVAGYTDVTWYATVAVGALVGNYTFGVALEGGNTLVPFVLAVAAPEEHGQKPPDVGEDTTAPTVTVTADGTLGASASFTLTADEDNVSFECRLTTDGVAGEWAACTSPKTYSGLLPGSYVFAARGTDKAGNVSAVVTKDWTVEAAPLPDTTAPALTVTSAGTLGTTASFTLSADEPDVTFECQLTTNEVAGTWEECTSPKTYSGLVPGSYIFSARGTDKAGNVSTVVTRHWTLASTVSFATAGVTVAENGRSAVLTLTRTNPQFPASVHYARVGGTARPGTDFSLASGVVQFPAGRATATIPVRIIDDRATERAETIVVRLSTPGAGTALGSRTSATVTVKASDQRPDALISTRRIHGYVGNNLYSTTGIAQYRTLSAHQGQARIFYARIYNDGNVANTFVLKGSLAQSRSAVRYYLHGVDVTRAMRSASGLRVTLQPGARVLLTVRISLGAHAVAGTTKSALVKATWRGDSVETDVVKAVVRVVR